MCYLVQNIHNVLKFAIIWYMIDMSYLARKIYKFFDKPQFLTHQICHKMDFCGPIMVVTESPLATFFIWYINDLTKKHMFDPLNIFFFILDMCHHHKAASMPVKYEYDIYCQISDIRHTKLQNFIILSHVSHLLLQLSSLNPLKPGVKLRMKM